jgi:hypothetical protein
MTIATKYPTRQHERLAELVGTWEGPVKTWFDPDSPVKEDRYKATIRAVAGGHAFVQEYQSALDGEAFQGCALISFDEARQTFTVDWVDGFHSAAPMHSEGAVPPRYSVVASTGTASGSSITTRGETSV